MQELISIVVPVYNVEKYIDTCVESIVCQTYENIEVILVNDGSIDDSLERIKYWNTKDSRIKVVNQQNRGVSAARNRALDIASGKWVCFIDSDDYVENNYIESLYHKVKENDADMAMFSIDERNDGNDTIVMDKRESLNSIIENKSIQGYPWNKIFNMEIIKKNGLTFVEGIVIWEDLLFCYMYILHIRKSVYFSSGSQDLYHYIKREDSATGKIDYKKERTKVLAAELMLKLGISSLKEENQIIVKRMYSNSVLRSAVYYGIEYKHENVRRKTKNALQKAKKFYKCMNLKYKMLFNGLMYFPRFTIFCIKVENVLTNRVIKNGEKI